MNLIISKAEEYLSFDKNSKTNKQIRALLDAKNYEKLKLLLNNRLVFGTAGLRAEMGPGYARMNDLTVIQASQGLCMYLLKVNPQTKTKGLVIGHDHRHNSQRFAKLTASVFLKKNIKVYFYTPLVHTPLVPFGVKTLNAACGIMITASHNPKTDNGYKVYWENACQIIPPHDAGIANEIMQNLEPWEGVWDVENQGCVDPFEEMVELYFRAVGGCSNGGGGGDLRFCYTAMHGVGLEFAKRGFKAFNIPDFIETSLQVFPDPDFPTVEFPNPEEGKGALKLAMVAAEQGGAKIILANDPDADRLAVAEQQQDGTWYIFSGNELGSILGSFILRTIPNPTKDIYMLASTVSSKMLGAMADFHGFSFEDTLTGFKWLGNRAIELEKEGKEVVFAFEEAIGFMCFDVVKDKDGVNALCILAENAIRLDNEGKTLFQHLESLYKKYGFFTTLNSYYICHSTPTIQKIFQKIRGSTTYDDTTSLTYPTQIGGVKIIGIRDLTVGYDSEKEDKKPLLPSSRDSEMITFKLENGAIITVRTSGTEPKIKYYSEMKGDSMEKAKKDLARVVEAFCLELLEPGVNQLVPRKE